MIRTIIQIDENACNGCGACASACHEGAIGMVNGKARLLRDDYCDGLGDCLPACPVNAITFIKREAAEYDQKAVLQHKRDRMSMPASHSGRTSQLGQWPCQIKLAPLSAPYLNGAALLIAADCTAFAYANLHEEFMKGKITLIGCPKLDAVDYSEKLTELLQRNEIQSVTVLRMEVPCCGGLEMAVKNALARSGKALSCQVVTFSIDGKILKHSAQRDKATS